MAYIILVLLGLCMGSFVNALVWRIHQSETRKLSSKEKRALSMTHGRSMCPNCRHQLKFVDLIPVVSWLSLKGKCRYCKKSIPDNPIVELLIALIFVISYVYWPITVRGIGLFDLICWLSISVGLVALLVYDLKWMLLPNKIIFKLIGIALFQILVDVIVVHRLSTLTSALYGVLVGGGIFYALFQISGGKWIGGGDVKLGALLGVLVGGPANSLQLIFVASLLGSLVSIPLIVVGRAKTSSRIPFGPFLIIAGVIVRLFGTSILAWYKHKFLLV